MKVFSKNVKNADGVFVTTSVSCSLTCEEFGFITYALECLKCDPNSASESLRLDLFHEFEKL